ncbi:hypothetical protein [Streptomyces sp. NPDC058656]|uniref:hypothetical protein n=1 Tax=unclassified Streptomyces TaxID=2593676 RepID=UPI003662A59B
MSESSGARVRAASTQARQVPSTIHAMAAVRSPSGWQVGHVPNRRGDAHNTDVEQSGATGTVHRLRRR